MKLAGRNRVLLLLLIGLVAPLCPGCAHAPATLTVQPARQMAAYSQEFSQAFASRTEDGTQEFILVADDAIKSAPREPGGPLTPVTKTPLRQVVHVRVLWEPVSGAEKTVTRNASISWLVFADTAAGTPGLREYQGNAFASLRRSGGGTTRVTLRNGILKPHSARGGLSDPIGVGRLEGTFTAIRNPARVRELLAAARARTAEASAAAH